MPARELRRGARRGVASRRSPQLRWPSSVPLADASLAPCCWVVGRRAAGAGAYRAHQSLGSHATGPDNAWMREKYERERKLR